MADEARLTQQVVHRIASFSPDAEITQQALGVVRNQSPDAEITQQALIIVRQRGVAAPGGGGTRIFSFIGS